jgi:hypothetical protein
MHRFGIVLRLWASALALFSVSYAQEFAPRMLAVLNGKDAEVTLISGETVSGRVSAYKFRRGLITEFTLRTAEGERRIPAAVIRSMDVETSAAGRLIAVAETADGTLHRAVNTDLGGFSRSHLHFDQALLPGKKPAYVLLQQVNEGFDSQIQVYDNPRAGETVAVNGLIGGLLNSYYVVRDGEAVRVHKRTYEEQFGLLYGDCPALRQQFPKIRWTDFAEHVAAHERLCR